VDVSGWSARELEIISRLRELGATTPDEATRKRIRRRLEGAAPGMGRRVTANLLAAAAALIALAGLGMVLSHDALPGDTLYPVKRVAESAELGLTFGEGPKANRHLKFAATRLDELAALRTGSPDLVSAFEREATAGAAGLTVLGVQGTGRELETLGSWVHEQTAKAAPFAEITSLLGRIDTRVRALNGRLGCYRITSGEPDELGAVPARDGCQVPAQEGLAPPTRTPGSHEPDSRDFGASTRSSESAPIPAAVPVPTPPVPPAGGTTTPLVILPPILAPTSGTAPSDGSAPPPLLSLPPLLPGLPGVGLG
jgi:hypothetical protein